MRSRFLQRGWFMPVLVLGLTGIALGAAWTSSDQYATWANGGFTVENDEWGTHHNFQSIWANSYSNWGVWSAQPDGYGVNAYPHVKKTIGIAINSLNSCTSSINVTVPSSSYVYNASYDIWVPGEVMIWMYHTSGDKPIAKSYDANGNAVPSYTNITVGGHTWNVYIGGSPKVVSFVNTGNTTNGSVDIKAVLQYAVSHGYVPNGTINDIQFGFEVCSTDNNGQNFTCNSYSLSYN